MQECSCPVAQLCPMLCNSMVYNPLDPLSIIFFQARVLDWVAIFYSKGPSKHRNWTHISYIGSWILYYCATLESPTQGHSLINILHANLHLRVLFLYNLYPIHHTHTHTHTHIHRHTTLYDLWLPTVDETIGFPVGSECKESDGRVTNTSLKACPGDFMLSLKGSENSLCLQKDSSGVLWLL